MTRAPVIWAAAVSVSLTAHVAAAAVLAWATRPDDTPVQQPPETQLELAAYQVPRSEAQKAEPDAQEATPGDTGGTRVDQDAIATSRTEAQTIQSAALAPEPDRGDAVAAAPVPAETAKTDSPTGAPATVVTPPTVTAAPQVAPAAAAPARVASSQIAAPVAPTSLSAAPLAPTTSALTAVQADSPAIPTTVSTGTQLAPVVKVAMQVETTPPVAEAAFVPPIESAPSPTVQPDAPAAPPAALPTAPADESRPTAEPLDQLPPPSERSRASLAFAAAGDGPVDPVSLTAFQSFMAPGDLGQQAAEVRDSIASTLNSIPCSRLQIRYDPDDNVVVMTGHVPEAGLRSTVLEAMQSKMGADIPVREDLLVLPRPQCGALAGIAQVGLPQSTDQITNPLLLGESTHAREFSYVDGDPLVLELQGADYDAYVYVDFFDAGGNVLHLMPNDFTPMQKTSAKAALTIGSERALSPGEPGLYIKIGPPYGQEIAVAFAASAPLYDGIRPLIEPAEPYLEWLQARVAEARQQNPDFKGEWVYFFVSTAAE